MMSETNREIHLVARPRGWPQLADFALVEAPIPEPADGEALVRNIFMSVDPYMRGRMSEARSYAAPYKLGQAMYGGAIGQVVASRTHHLKEGDIVLNSGAWHEYIASDPRGLERIEAPVSPLSLYLGILGMPGMTAYVGLYDLAQPREGETVFVSAASGAVGSVVGQLARIRGCRAVGSAGSAEKVRYLLDELGFDAAFNYKEVDLGQALAESCPDGVDVYFDNVGGDHLRAAIAAMNSFGRITACGMISRYNDTEPTPGPDNMMMIVGKRLTIRGFIVSDGIHAGRAAAFREEVGRYYAEGRMRYRETVVEGIERAPEAFLAMMRGDHLGKMVVRLAPIRQTSLTTSVAAAYDDTLYL